ncbi:MAG TPA: DNA-processing protein DprA [Egibacteraceae bacterium]|nr:DNA-processing protein DprA [Egibacteraceae bacterium]
MSPPEWAAALSSGADPALVAWVVRLAAADWAHPDRIRRVVAARLDAGQPTDAGAVLEDLEGCGAGPLPPPAAAGRLAAGLVRLGARVSVVGQPGYPHRLAAAWPELGAPLWLFVRSATGRLPSGTAAVAVVGTRQPTLEGLETARALARILAARGVVVVSGMARGIDQAAHAGALDADGPTVGVLGTGLDVDYPHRDGPLRDAVAAAGGLVTEYRLGTPPRAPNFLWRNRIIAGLADATVVVEGRARSGALQTARLAAAQGREVLAVPGSLHQPASRAPLDLIRDGARPLTHLDEILEVLDGLPVMPGEPDDAPVADHGLAPVADHGLAPVAADVLRLLGAVPATPDRLAAASGHPIGAVLGAVADLTVRGLAAATPRGFVAVPSNGRSGQPPCL